MDVVVQEATEDVYRMGAVGPLAENYLDANFATVWRKRALWLACLFVAELFTFTAMAHFEDSIAKLVVLSLFIPLCLSTGGNSGSQAATLITRALALGQVSLENFVEEDHPKPVNAAMTRYWRTVEEFVVRFGVLNNPLPADEQLGELIARFQGANVVVCADHGDAWGEDGLWEHGIHHRTVLEVPLLFRLHGRIGAA